MYIYFKSIDKVLTCEQYPQVISVEEMKSDNYWKDKCDKWEKNNNEDGTFTLSFKHKKISCSCDNSNYINYEDFEDYECYECGRPKNTDLEYGENLYLQNSGNMDIVCVGPTTNLKYCKLCVVDGYPNIYKWSNDDGDKAIYALHVNDDDELSDKNIVEEINDIKENCHIIFVYAIIMK